MTLQPDPQPHPSPDYLLSALQHKHPARGPRAPAWTRVGFRVVVLPSIEFGPLGIIAWASSAIRGSIREVQVLTAQEFGTPLEKMWGRERKWKFTIPRQVAVALARETTGKSFPALGRAFKRDHTSMLEACRRVKELSDASPAFAARINSIRERLRKG